MKQNRDQQGEIIIFFEAILWSLFPVVTIIALRSVSPLLALASSTFFASIFFAVIITIRKTWSDLKNSNALKDILWSTFYIGILFYAFYFYGLKYTSAGNASIIALSEVFFSYVWFQLWHKDHMPIAQVIGAVFMLLGALIVLYPNFTTFHPGDMFILLAAVMAPFGNRYAQRARKQVASETIMFVRSVVTTPVILMLALLFGEKLSLTNLHTALGWLLLNGFFILGVSKILWIEGIHRITVTKAQALSSISPLFTLLFAWLFLQNSPTSWQLLALIPMGIGMILLRMNKMIQIPK